MDSSANDPTGLSAFHAKDVQMRPVAYKFRFTFTDQDKEHTYQGDLPKLKRWQRIAKLFLDHTVEKYAFGNKAIGGIEFLNKLGEYTYAHFHLHFYSVSPRDTIAKQYRRILEDRFDDQESRGIKAFYLHATPTRDDDKFWRYPLKQGKDYKLTSGFPYEKIDHMFQVAHDSWKIGQEVALAKNDKRDSADTLFDRAREKIKKLNPQSKIEITKCFIEFYKEDSKPINRQIITGYVTLYQLHEGLITAMSLAESWQ